MITVWIVLIVIGIILSFWFVFGMVAAAGRHSRMMERDLEELKKNITVTSGCAVKGGEDD